MPDLKIGVIKAILTLEQAAESSERMCVRYVYRAKRWDHITLYLNRAQLLRVETRRKITTLCLLFKILSSQCPSYLSNKYNFRSSIVSRVTRAHDLLHVLAHIITESYSILYNLSGTLFHIPFLTLPLSLLSQCP
uniref:Uncharacterized protein n=1 Tax=Cacopsylla melanoneura TaxID=428564 RepID=A0A8D8ZSB3_9HEMI